MLAGYEEIAGYLLDHDLIRAKSIVDGDLAIRDVSRRHANFEVVSEGSRSYFLKQDVTGGEAGIATVSHEAEVYRLFTRARRAKDLHRYVPRWYGFDSAEGLLVLEGMPGARNLAEHHLSRGRVSPAVAAELGRALGTLHATFRAGSEELENLPSHPPWVLRLPRPGLRLYLNSSAANREFLRIVQTGDLADRFDELSRGWTVETVIHGDLKWSNCLVITGADSRRRRPGVRLVDWELAGRGDASWDVGSLLSEYLNLWVSSIPISGYEPPDRFLDLARFSLKSMWPSVRSYWTAYVRAARLGPPEEARRLARAVRFSAARLVQTAYELLQDQAAVTNAAILRLQLAHNILARPDEAAVQLLGLPLSDGWRHA